MASLSVEGAEATMWKQLQELEASHGRSTALKVVGSLLQRLAAQPEVQPAPATSLAVRTSRLDDSVTSVPSPAGAESPSSDGLPCGTVTRDRKPHEVRTQRRKSHWENVKSMAEEAIQADPWAHLRLDLRPAEHAIRHRYNARTKEWSTDDVFVKMSDVKFAQGAMRECFAMKKRSAISSSWTRAGNYVAKRYMKGVGREEYFNDVVLQMDTKRLGDEFNKLRPPKPVDVMQCYLVEFHERPGSPLFCVEHLVEGHYVKYNSNNSFVRHNQDGITRSTPQAFSHFSYEHSKGQMMVVDVQGVGDLYTDPQIHTADGEGYGEGNLGVRGFALFFFTHVCSPLCSQLGLSRFPICGPELNLLTNNLAVSPNATASKHCPLSPTSAKAVEGTVTASWSQKMVAECDHGLGEYEEDPALQQLEAVAGPEATLEALLASLLEDMPCLKQPPSVTALTHWQVAQLYGEACMTEGSMYGRELAAVAAPAGLYHLRVAARSGVRAAALALWRLHAGMEQVSSRLAALADFAHDLAQPLSTPDLATAYLLAAARGGVVSAAGLVAEAYATGAGLPLDLGEAFKWYQRTYEWVAGEEPAEGAEAVPKYNEGEEGPEGSDVSLNAPEKRPVLHEILAAQAELLGRGGVGLPRDPAAAAEKYNEAAEAATEAMKGKLANKYYERASMLDCEEE